MNKQLMDMVAKLVAEAMAQQKPAKAGKMAGNGKSERSLKNEALAKAAFKKRGFSDVQPHVNVKTFNRWVAEGRKPKTGEKAVKVKNLRLFHITQTEEISDDVKTELLAKQATKFQPKLVDQPQVSA